MSPEEWQLVWRVADGATTLGLAVFIGLAVFKGWVVPAKIHEEIVAQYTAAVAAERTRADEAEERKERADKATREVLAQLLAAVPKPPTTGGDGRA